MKYKLKEEFKGQCVTVYTADGDVIKLNNASQKEFEKVFSIKGNEKFIVIEGESEPEVKKVSKINPGEKLTRGK